MTEKKSTFELLDNSGSAGLEGRLERRREGTGLEVI